MKPVERPPLPPSETAKKGALVAASVIFTLLLLELGMRLLWENPYARTTSSYVVEMRLNRPNLDRKINREWLDQESPEIDFRTDANGYILPSKQYADPDATIAFLGGSTTEALYVKEPLRFPALVSTFLSDAGYRVNTINAGTSSNTTHDAINVLLNVVALDMPSAVVLMEATNDAGVLARDPTYSSRMAATVSNGMQARWFVQKASAMSWQIAYLRSRLTDLELAAYTHVVVQQAPDVEVPLLPPTVESRYQARLRIFAAVTRAIGAKPVLMTQPLASYRNALTPAWSRNAQQDRFNQIIRKVAAETGSTLVDLATHFDSIEEFRARPELYLYDGLHATDKGSQVEARLISDCLLPLVADSTLP